MASPQPNRWVLGARIKTLPAAVVPVAVGTAVASTTGPIIWWRVGAALVVSLALQVATNFVNDYADGERGTDDATRVGPVRLVGSGLATASEVKRAAAAAFAVAGVAGAALALAVGPELFVVGALCMVAGWAYTGGPKPYGYLGLGEVMVFVFFGVVATVGSGYVQSGEVSALAMLASVPVGLLAVGLLVINNLRDIPGDTESNKRTLAVMLGEQPTRTAFSWLYGAVAVLIVLLALSRPFSLLALAGLVTVIPAVKAVLGGSRGADLIPVLGQTGRTQLVTGLLLAIGLAI